MNNLLLTYEENDLPSRVVGGIEIFIPYVEVIPLLLPASPVARMLRERGIWPVARR